MVTCLTIFSGHFRATENEVDQEHSHGKEIWTEAFRCTWKNMEATEQ